MHYIIVGLGNPGVEYEVTRHNTGRRAVMQFAHAQEVTDWKSDKVLKAQKNKIKNDVCDAVLLLPDTYMNKSGTALKSLISSEKKAARLVVVYDDLDLPFGKLRIKFGGSAGGHRGMESVIRSIKTKDFIRVRIGIAPTTPSGKLKKPQGEKAVLDFLMSPFSKKEEQEIDAIFGRVSEALSLIAQDDIARAMNQFN